MRNRYKGMCYRCGSVVEVQQGHFERYRGGWRTIHAQCAIEQRKEKEARDKEYSEYLEKAYNEGMQAYATELPCPPYPPNSDLHTAWTNGFYDGYKKALQRLPPRVHS
jgi:hypothetical protein